MSYSLPNQDAVSINQPTPYMVHSIHFHKGSSKKSWSIDQIYYIRSQEMITNKRALWLYNRNKGGSKKLTKLRHVRDIIYYVRDTGDDGIENVPYLRSTMLAVMASISMMITPMASEWSLRPLASARPHTFPAVHLENETWEGIFGWHTMKNERECLADIHWNMRGNIWLTHELIYELGFMNKVANFKTPGCRLWISYLIFLY